MTAGADAPAAAPAPPAEDWSDRVSLTFTIGVYVALNAVRDAYLLVDAPDCAHLKTQFVQGNHDWNSTLTSTGGLHRVANTDLHPWKMVATRDGPLEELLGRMADHPATGALLITSMPMATITGLDYQRLVRNVARRSGKPVASIGGSPLSGDWLDGYAATLEALAQVVPVEPAEPRPRAVAVVGYLMDRNEGDHRANLAEMKRLLGALGLDLVSVWPSGGTVGELARVREAAAIVSLPYGRQAAKLLGQRLQVPVIETELPLGLDGTERWLRQVAGALGVSEAVEGVLDAELSRVVPLVEFVVPYHLLHRRMLFVGDPHLGLAMTGLAVEVGCEVERYVILNRPANARALVERVGPERVCCDPKRDALMELVRSLLDQGRCELVVGDSTGVTASGSAATVELGFPSFFTHALGERPFLFSRGFLVLVERMMNELRRAELAAAHGPAEGQRPERGARARG